MEREIAITKFALRRPVTTIVLVLAAIFFGFQSYTKMGLELFPNVDIPVVSVTTILTGASPEIIDRDVTDVLEEQINTIAGIKNITSSSYEGRSVVVIEFVLERDIDAAASDVRAKVNLAQYDLPSDCEDPIVSKLDVGAFPVMNIAVRGGEDYRTRSHFVDKVMKPRLQTISGVGSVDFVGFRDREIRVWLKPADLEAQGLTASDVSSALTKRHLELPGGRIENQSQELSIRVEGEYATVEDLSRLVVKESSQGRLVRLRDVADVEDGFEDMRTGSFLNGDPVITVQVKKQQGVNEVQVCQRVKDALKNLESVAPPGVEMLISSDTSDFITRSMDGVESDLMLGVLLTALLMFVFLRSIRVTVVAIVSIPTSLISTFILCKALGFTVNNLTMLAMSLAVGMVIDNTIVVIENIFRHIEQGKTRARGRFGGRRSGGICRIGGNRHHPGGFCAGRHHAGRYWSIFLFFRHDHCGHHAHIPAGFPYPDSFYGLPSDETPDHGRDPLPFAGHAHESAGSHIPQGVGVGCAIPVFYHSHCPGNLCGRYFHGHATGHGLCPGRGPGGDNPAV